MDSTKNVTTAPPKYNTLVHFEIPAKEPSKIARFYEQLFGWKFTKMEGGNMDYWLISHKDAKSPAFDVSQEGFASKNSQRDLRPANHRVSTRRHCQHSSLQPGLSPVPRLCHRPLFSRRRHFETGRSIQGSLCR